MNLIMFKVDKNPTRPNTFQFLMKRKIKLKTIGSMHNPLKPKIEIIKFVNKVVQKYMMKIKNQR